MGEGRELCKQSKCVGLELPKLLIFSEKENNSEFLCNLLIFFKYFNCSKVHFEFNELTIYKCTV